jgi:hypothetical protein
MAASRVEVFVCDAVAIFWFFGFCFLLLVFSLASALCFLASRVAPVRGSTYFSLSPKGTSFGARGKEK